MLHVDSNYSKQYNNVFTSNPIFNNGTEKIGLPKKDKEEKRATVYMIGATTLASIVAFGILGYKGKLGPRIQEFLGGKVGKAVSQGTNAGTNLSISSSVDGTPQDNARKVLGELYGKIITKAQEKGNSRRVLIFTQFKDNMDSLDIKTIYSNLFDALYKDLRLGEYPTSSLVTGNIEEITAKSTTSIKVKNQNGWHYRIPIGRKSVKSVDRISINALADENLIKSLDSLFASGKVKGYYKTPETNLDWLERHDPITIYLDEKATPDTLNKVKAACEKYIRSSEDVLSGEKFAAGMALQKSPDEQEIMAILEQAKNIDPILEGVLRPQFTDKKSGKLIASAGYVDSAKKLFDLING